MDGLNKNYKAFCYVCGEEVKKSLEKIKRNKHQFCTKKHYYQFLKSDDNPKKGKKRELSDYAREQMSKSAVKNLLTKDAQRKSALARVGIKLSEEHKAKIRKHGKYGWKNVMWKGRWAGYVAKHVWAHKYINKEKICVSAAVEGYLCKGRLELSNNSHKYLKRVNDWDWRCKYHHDKYDFERNLREIGVKSKVNRFFMKFGNKKKIDFTIDAIVTIQYLS